MLSLVYNKKIDQMIDLNEDLENPQWQVIKTTQEKVKTHILPLQNFRIKETEKKQYLILKNMEKKVARKIAKGKYKKLALSLTDDPKVEWAADWSDLGCFRLVLKFFEPKITKSKNQDGTVDVMAEVKQGNYNKDMTIPDKVVNINE